MSLWSSSAIPMVIVSPAAVLLQTPMVNIQLHVHVVPQQILVGHAAKCVTKRNMLTYSLTLSLTYTFYYSFYTSIIKGCCVSLSL